MKSKILILGIIAVTCLALITSALAVIGLPMLGGAAITGFTAITAGGKNQAVCNTAAQAAYLGNVQPVTHFDREAGFTAKVGTWNTYMDNPVTVVNAGLNTLIEHVGILGLQELSPRSRRDKIISHLDGKGWGYLDSGSPIGIAYDTGQYKVLASGAVETIGVERVESGVSGTSIGPRSVQWAQVENNDTGGVFFLVNHHIIPDVESRGHLTEDDTPKRVALYRKQMSGLMDLVNTLRPVAPVIITGDWNFDSKRDERADDPAGPKALLAGSGIRSNWHELGWDEPPTHANGGGRWIDYIAATNNAEFVSQRTRGKYGSDHAAVTVTLKRGETTPSSGGGGGVVSAALDPSPASTPSPPGGGSTNLPTKLTVAGTKLNATQIQVASTIIAVGRAAGISDKGLVIALATAFQESTLTNLNGGDRDSVGVFQQRPSTGWGTVKQIRDVQKSAEAFFGVASHTSNPGLTDIPGWEDMSVTDAAQRVQRSAFPDAYAKWEAAATALLSALSGTAVIINAGYTQVSAGNGACVTQTGLGGLIADCPPTGLPIETGTPTLTPDAINVARCGYAAFPTINPTTYESDGDHGHGKAVDLMIPDWETDAGAALGHRVAEWARVHATQLGVTYVIFRDRIWSVARDAEGWRPYRHPSGVYDYNARHWNHVHVSVKGNGGTGLVAATGNDGLEPGGWHLPTTAPIIATGYFGKRGPMWSATGGRHTGQDFAAATGTPLYAVHDGVVVTSQSNPINGKPCKALPICGSGGWRSYGNWVRIKVGDQTTVLYAHLSQRLVSEGDPVTAGQLIGYAGAIGNADGAHLHFEVAIGGTPVDPVTYLKNKGVVFALAA